MSRSVFKITMFVMLLGFISFTAALKAVDYYNASGIDVSSRLQDSLAYYHQFTDDQHWYGSNSWAVRYDFRNYFQGVPAQFTATNIWVYFPNQISEGSLSYSFCLENINQPDLEAPFLQEDINVSEVATGWNMFSINETVLDSVVWVIIDYETNETDQFMSASAGDGEHSFYESEGYYYSMSANNYNAEFLVCLEGEFFLDVVDIELSDFQIDPQPAFLTEVYPSFSLHNYHSSTVDSIYILYNIYAPFGTVTDTISLPGANSSLEPDEDLILDLTGNADYSYTIGDSAAQYRFSATIINNEDSFGYNNNICLEYELFELQQGNAVIENFLSLSDMATEEIWSDQATLEQNVEIINYFPVLTDLPFYSNAAVDRFNEYSLYGLPATVVAGSEKLIGYNSEVYTNQLVENLDDFFNSAGTYISADSLYAELNEFTEIANLKIFLKNEESFLFSSYLNELQFYVAVVEDSVIYNNEITGSVLHDIIVEKSDLALGFGEVDSTSFNLDIGSLDPFSDLSNLKLLYWIQNNETKRIDYCASTPYLQEIDYNMVTGGGSNDIPEAPQLKIYPNPFGGEKSLNLEIASSRDMTELKVKIYNIKGQMVRTLETGPMGNRMSKLTWDGRDEQGSRAASGIYFIRVGSNDVAGKGLVKKCLLLRD